jgi:CheY-like chemotaxis protein
MAKVLVVDDSMFTRLNICRMLEEAGHETLEAANGREGLEMAVSAKPDIILSDLLMPELDGIGFLNALRENGIDLPVIILSADIQETKRQQCLSLGTAGFISKPPPKKEVQELIIQVLAGGAA